MAKSPVSKSAPKLATGNTGGRAAAARITAKAKAEAPRKTDTIATVKHDTANTHVVVIAGDQTVTYPRNRETAELRKLAVIGASFKAVSAYLAANKPKAELANGITARVAPQSAKAVADQKGAKLPTAPKAAPTKAPKARPAKAGDGTPFKALVKPEATTIKPGSDRYARLAAVQGAKTLGEALACTTKDGKPVRMDNLRGMLERGHVAF